MGDAIEAAGQAGQQGRLVQPVKVGRAAWAVEPIPVHLRLHLLPRPPSPDPSTGSGPIDPDIYGSTTGGAVSDRFGVDYYIDLDQDGLVLAEEQAHGSDPNKADTDGDGLSDGDEVVRFGSWPNSVDTEGDGLWDGDEVRLAGNPGSSDTDGDGLSDLTEANPGTALGNADTDADGLWDGDEVNWGTYPTAPDSDNDCVWDGDEIRYSGNPLDTDTGDDGNWDGVEWTATNMVTPNSEASAPLSDYCSPRD